MVTIYIQLEHVVYCSECDSPTPNLMKHTGFSIPANAPRWRVEEYPTPETEIVQCNLYNPVQNRDNQFLSHGVGYYDTQLQRWLLKVDVTEYWEATDHPTMDIYELANQNPPADFEIQDDYEFARDQLTEDITADLEKLGLTLQKMVFSEHRSGPLVIGSNAMAYVRKFPWDIVKNWLARLNINQFRDNFEQMWRVIAHRYGHIEQYPNILFRGTNQAYRIDLPYQRFLTPIGLSHNHPLTRVYCEVEIPSLKRRLFELVRFLRYYAEFTNNWVHKGGGDGYFERNVGGYEGDFDYHARKAYTELDIDHLPRGEQYEIVKNNPTIRRLLMRHRLNVLVQTFVTTQWEHICNEYGYQCDEAFRDTENWLYSSERFEAEINDLDLIFDAGGKAHRREDISPLHYLYPVENVQA